MVLAKNFDYSLSLHELFSKLIHDLNNDRFKVLMCITYSVLPCKLATRLFQSSSSLVKIVSHHEVHIIFKDTEHQLQKKILHHFLHYSFL